MIKIGITGGIGAGKSEVARLLAGRGARVVDADRVAHATYAPGSPGFEAVVAAFGVGVVGPDGAIDRGALGRLVFADPACLKQLTDIVWPLTRARVEESMREAAAAGAIAFVVEAVALREAGWRDLVDEVWLVRAPKAAVRERLRRRPGISAADIDARVAAQKAASLGLEDAGVVIENDGSLERLEPQVEAAWLAALARMTE